MYSIQCNVFFYCTKYCRLQVTMSVKETFFYNFHFLFLFSNLSLQSSWSLKLTGKTAEHDNIFFLESTDIIAVSEQQKKYIFQGFMTKLRPIVSIQTKIWAYFGQFSADVGRKLMTFNFLFARLIIREQSCRYLINVSQ